MEDKSTGSSGMIAYGLLIVSAITALLEGDYQWALIASGLFAIAAEIHDNGRINK